MNIFIKNFENLIDKFKHIFITEQREEYQKCQKAEAEKLRNFRKKVSIFSLLFSLIFYVLIIWCPIKTYYLYI